MYSYNIEGSMKEVDGLRDAFIYNDFYLRNQRTRQFKFKAP